MWLLVLAAGIALPLSAQAWRPTGRWHIVLFPYLQPVVSVSPEPPDRLLDDPNFQKIRDNLDWSTPRFKECTTAATKILERLDILRNAHPGWFTNIAYGPIKRDNKGYHHVGVAIYFKPPLGTTLIDERPDYSKGSDSLAEQIAAGDAQVRKLIGEGDGWVFNYKWIPDNEPFDVSFVTGEVGFDKWEDWNVGDVIRDQAGNGGNEYGTYFEFDYPSNTIPPPDQICPRRGPSASSSRRIGAVGGIDPNAKAGSEGAGAQHFISGAEPLRYEIFFTNEETAGAPAQEVLATDRLDPTKVDLSSLSLGLISFGDDVIAPPPGISDYSTDVDLRPAKNLIVRVTVHLDSRTGILTWRFRSLDPATGQPPDDPLAGFLPPDTSPPQGEGSVVFTVMPKSGLATGTEVRNKATIVFDQNAPIDTQVWLNTLDDSTPSSHVLPLPAAVNSTSFDVHWVGADDGAGIQDYSVFVSEGGGPFTAWQIDTPDRSATFTGESGKRYRFYSVARDRAGNVEDRPGEADAATLVDTVPPTITCQTPAPRFLLHQTGASVSATLSDATSGPGVLTPASPQAASTASVGSQYVSYSGTDVAGNVAGPVRCNYVVGYKFLGFFPPLPKTVKVGSTLPVKFALGDVNSVRISDIDAASLVQPANCKIAVVLVKPAGLLPGFPKYDAKEKQFIFNLKTTSAMKGANGITVTVTIGSTIVTTSQTQPITIS